MTTWSEFRKQAHSLALPNWSEGIGLLFGLGMVLLAFPLSKPDVKGAVILGSLASLAAGAGVLAGMRTDLKFLPRSLATNRGARIGARTGLLSAVLGGAVIVAVTAAEGNSTGVKSLAAVMSILPSMLTGMIAGGWTAGLRAVPNPSVPVSLAPPAKNSWGWLILALHLVLTGLGYLSPLFLADFTSEVMHRIASDHLAAAPDRTVVRTVVRTEPEPAPPPIPSSPAMLANSQFVYEMSNRLKSAPAWRWEVLHTESIALPYPTTRLTVSPDGTLLAYVENTGVSTLIKVIHLASRRTVATFTEAAAVMNLDFAPNSKRLMAVVLELTRPIHILDLESSEIIQLPRPALAAIPSGPIRWWTESEVVFLKSEDEVILMDLNTLQLDDSDSSKFFKALTPEQKLRWSTDTARMTDAWSWHFSIVMAPVTYDAPYPARRETWPVKEDGQYLAIKDTKFPYQRILPSVPVAVGDRFVYPPDSGMLLHQHKDRTVIMYFGLRPAPKLCFKVEMPWTITGAPNGRGVAEQIASHQLCAFICEPITDPLNGNVVALNRDKIKALVRFSEWKEEEAHCWIAEEYSAVEEGDVIGDMHVWEDGKMKPAGPSMGQEWWAPLFNTDFTEEDPEVVNVPIRQDPPELRSEKGALVVGSPKPSVNRATSTTSIFVEEPAPQSTSGQLVPDSDPRRSMDENIRRFVHVHHQKASQGDVEGVVADYAEAVDHFSNGSVNRDFILRDETAYHAKLSSQSESVDGSIVVKPVTSGTYDVTYPLSVRWTKLNGESGGGVFDIALRLRTNDNGFEIIRHRSVKQP